MKKQTSFQRTIAFIVIGVGLIAVGVAGMSLLTLPQAQAGRAVESSVVPARVDYAAPALELHDLDGNPRALSDYLGQVVLVNMWATWCPPCIAELPTLESFYHDYADGGFVIIGIDDGEELGTVKEYALSGLTFPIWADPTYLSEGAFMTINLPSSFVIDRQGRVRLQWVGAISRAMLEKYVVPIIEE
jgi:cytochrome c biogenesis protein CcmG/thiol:disulfide interchange protein DsbE